MGDIADWLMDSADLYGDEDSDAFWDQIAADNYQRKLYRGLRTCRYCGTSGLRWMHTERGWCLATAAFVHVCPRPIINATEGFDE